MEQQSPFILIVVMLFAIVMGVLFESAKAETENRVPVPIRDLASLVVLRPSRKWCVTVMRRSGYVHDEWEFTGTATGAVEFANLKLAKARIDLVQIVTNNEKRFEVRAFYESTGTRRAGKYVGGYVITPG